MVLPVLVVVSIGIQGKSQIEFIYFIFHIQEKTFTN